MLYWQTGYTGTYPVIFFSFAFIKTGSIDSIKFAVKMIIRNVFDSFRDIMNSDLFNDNDKAYYASVTHKISDEIEFFALNNLCIYLEKYYGKNVIILLDKYNTPMDKDRDHAYIIEFKVRKPKKEKKCIG
ncbi:AAA family ATPase [Sporofaciens musculi]|uniref:AAA family ATPase n=1 Tax=Sporofaciens musculi TaxID=2681861 RepID=UPI00256FF243|nr:AAA family ATPase [Sporofaciens musculi]